MQDKITLTPRSLGGAVAALMAAALLAGAGTRYFFDAPLSLVMLVTCLSPAATVLLLYVAHLVHSHPQMTRYLVVMKVLGLASICLGLLVLLDFLVPMRVQRTMVYSVTPQEQGLVADLGDFQVPVTAEQAGELYERQPVSLTVTPLFHRLEEVHVGSGQWMLYHRPLLEKMLMVFGALLLLYPMCMLRFRPKVSDDNHNVAAFGLLVAPSYIISLIAVGLWTKFFLVHVLHTVSKM